MTEIRYVATTIEIDVFDMLIPVFVTCRLDCLYADVLSYLLEILLKIQNKAARQVLRIGRKRDSKELVQEE